MESCTQKEKKMAKLETKIIQQIYEASHLVYGWLHESNMKQDSTLNLAS